MNFCAKKWKKLIFIVCLILVGSLIVYKRIDLKLKETECQIKLKSIYSSLYAYYDEHKHLPAHDKWYDLLLEQGDLSADVFRCPSIKKNKGLGNYTINHNLDNLGMHSAQNTVLVFEGNLGWNKFDGDIKFVHKDDYASLQWGK
jgi:hypothetical protein